MRRAAAALAIVLLSTAAALPQDQPTGSTSDKRGPMALPKDVQVCVRPVIGPPHAISRKLEADLRDRLAKKGHADDCSPAGRLYDIQGYVVASRNTNEVKIEFAFDTKSNDKLITRFQSDLTVPRTEDPWAAMTDDVTSRIADKVGTMLTS